MEKIIRQKNSQQHLSAAMVNNNNNTPNNKKGKDKLKPKIPAGFPGTNMLKMPHLGSDGKSFKVFYLVVILIGYCNSHLFLLQCFSHSEIIRIAEK